ncbi:MAG: DUF962 domain-containing protein [Bernardetiaceae bacterium]|nr:DUF962 domain-containing protein [Bernardetiaceae bacterium]
MRTIDDWLEAYGESHQNSFNKKMHWICVPIIFFSLLALLWSIPSEAISAWLPATYAPFFNFATIFISFALVFYLRLSVMMAVGLGIFAAICLMFCYIIAKNQFISLWALALILFILAWIGQFYGHKVEGKKPSFIKDVQFLLIGPAWLLAFIYRKLGISY